MSVQITLKTIRQPFFVLVFMTNRSIFKIDQQNDAENRIDFAMQSERDRERATDGSCFYCFIDVAHAMWVNVFSKRMNICHRNKIWLGTLCVVYLQANIKPLFLIYYTNGFCIFFYLIRYLFLSSKNIHWLIIIMIYHPRRVILAYWQLCANHKPFIFSSHVWKITIIRAINWYNNFVHWLGYSNQIVDS